MISRLDRVDYHGKEVTVVQITDKHALVRDAKNNVEHVSLAMLAPLTNSTQQEAAPVAPPAPKTPTVVEVDDLELDITVMEPVDSDEPLFIGELRGLIASWKGIRDYPGFLHILQQASSYKVINQTKLGDAMEVSTSTVRNWVGDTLRPPGKMMFDVMEYIKLHVNTYAEKQREMKSLMADHIEEEDYNSSSATVQLVEIDGKTFTAELRQFGPESWTASLPQLGVRIKSDSHVNALVDVKAQGLYALIHGETPSMTETAQAPAEGGIQSLGVVPKAKPGEAPTEAPEPPPVAPTVAAPVEPTPEPDPAIIAASERAMKVAEDVLKANIRPATEDPPPEPPPKPEPDTSDSLSLLNRLSTLRRR